MIQADYELRIAVYLQFIAYGMRTAVFNSCIQLHYYYISFSNKDWWGMRGNREIGYGLSLASNRSVVLYRGI
jgi:hypothetical protein